MGKNEEFNDLINFVETSSSLNKVKKKKQKRIVILLLNIISISLLIIGGYGLKSISDTKKDLEEAKALEEKLAKDMEKAQKNTPKKEEKEDDSEEETLVENPTYTDLHTQNQDFVGWIKVNSTGVDLPVVHTDNNEFYLTHDFNKNWNSMGWVFADYRNTFPNLSKNTILYGHTYRDTIMFSTLSRVLTNDWRANESNHYITFNTLYKDMQWQVFSIYTLEATNDYLITDFETDDDYKYFPNFIKSRSKYNFNVDVTTDDKILTLSTCYIDGNHRLVVHAKML